MKIHHAAALALVGWYLMMPPFVNRSNGLTVADPKAPLPQWSTFGSSDSAAECEQQRIYNIDRSKGLPQTPANVAVADQMLHAACIASDDPRLKEK